MPAGLEALVLDGSLTLFVVGVLIVEAAALLRHAHLQARPLGPILANALSGLCLLLAVHAALRGQASAVALWIAAGGLAHLADIVWRLRR